MNLLLDELPDGVMIDGQAVPINTDFRTCLRTILVFESDQLTNFEKRLMLLENLYPYPPTNTEQAIVQGIKFLNGGETPKEGEDPQPRLYSFSKDANFIFAAFRQTHGIDLQTEALHWWKFMALFMDLGSETAFCGLVNFRKRLKTGKASAEERQEAQELGDLLDVPEPDLRTPEERRIDAEFMKLVKG